MSEELRAALEREVAYLDVLGRVASGPVVAERIRAALAASPSESGLDAAWKRAEAALPKGWRIKSVTHYEDGSWDAEALIPYVEAVKRRTGYVKGSGPTPATALDALAGAMLGAEKETP